MVELTRRAGAHLPFDPTTEYINTIPAAPGSEEPGDAALEWRIRTILRWNAMAMVVRANRKPGELGGHIASFASSATLYDVGFNHFWRAPSAEHPGDLLYIQGHSSPGIYARAFLEGRISESQLDNFRMEVDGKGISSYPHPWLMPDFWQTPTVSMGLGPISAIYQARFWKYLEGRGLMPEPTARSGASWATASRTSPNRWARSRSPGARARQPGLRHQLQSAAPRRPGARQRQDHPGTRRRVPRRRLERAQGALGQPLGSAVGARQQGRAAQADDGNRRRRVPELQGLRRRVHARAFLRQVRRKPRRWSPTSDDDIWHLNRGGHDPHKVYAAYHCAVTMKGQPTVILAKTVKGYGMGEAGEAQNITHQQKKMDSAAIRAFRDRFNIPIRTTSWKTCRSTTRARTRRK
jgi:pyruvate dehydrogenase E1 component